MSPDNNPNPPQSSDNAISRLSLSEQILAAFGTRTVPDAKGFVKQLAHQTDEVANQCTTLQIPINVRAAFLQKSMVSVVDRMFDFFQIYCHEFNVAAVNTQFRINCQRPVMHQEAGSNTAPTTIVFKGSLTASTWTLLIRGVNERIDCFIVPSNKLIAVTASPSAYKSQITITSTWDRGRVAWWQDQEAVSPENLETITRHLFSILVQLASGQIAPPES